MLCAGHAAAGPRSCCAAAAAPAVPPASSMLLRLLHAVPRAPPRRAAAVRVAAGDGGGNWGELAPNSVGGGERSSSSTNGSSSSRGRGRGRGDGSSRGGRGGRGGRDSSRSRRDDARERGSDGSSRDGGWYDGGGSGGDSWYTSGSSSSRGRGGGSSSSSSRQDRDGGRAAAPERDDASEWACAECGASNWARRTVCFACKAPDAARSSRVQAQAQASDWTCPECGESNFGRRTVCFACRTPAEERVRSKPQRESDWLCACGESNFGWRTTCFICRAARGSPDGSSSSSNAAAAGSDGGGSSSGYGSSSSSASSSSQRWQQQQQHQAPASDWECPSCAYVNFARNRSCRSCDGPRPAAASSRAPRGARAGAAEEKRKKGSDLVEKVGPRCYGCGAPLQSEVPAAAGFVAADKLAVKKKHRQLDQVLCARCTSLSNGAMIPAVQDFTQKAWAEQQQQLLAVQGRQQQQQQQQQESALQQQEQEQEQQQEQQQQAPARRSRKASVTAGEEPAAAAEDNAAAGAVPAAPLMPQQAVSGLDAGVSSETLELLGRVLVSPEQLRQKIAEVRSVKALVVMLVDLLDVSGTLMGKVRDMVGNNPIVLVGTKMDLLPAGAAPRDVAEWLTEAATRRRLQMTSTHLVSSRSGEGVAAVAAKIARERKGRDVFVVGAANVGKSAFVRALLREMSSMTGGNFDAAAAATSRYLPVESAMPGTTLGIIPLQAFETGGTLYDTPGVHLHHRMPHMLTPAELKLLHPRRRLAPFSPPTPLELMQSAEEDEDEDDGAVQRRGPDALSSSRSSSKKPKTVSASYLWSGLARVDVVAGPPSTSLVFYGPASMRVFGLPLLTDGQDVEVDWEGGSEQEDSSGSSSDGDGDSDARPSSSSTGASRFLVGTQSVAARGGLVPHSVTLPVPAMASSSCLADITVSGLPGWVALHAPFAKQPLVLRVWAPRGVEVFLRPPLPVPPPRKASGQEEGEGAVSGEALAELGAAMDLADAADQDWEVHRQQLGLRPMTAEDEEVIKLLMYGSEERNITGIVDLPDDDEDAEGGGAEEAEEEAEEDEAEEGSSSSRSSRRGGAGAAAMPSAEQLVATAAQALGTRRRGRASSSSSTASGDAEDPQPVVVEGDGGGRSGGGSSQVRRRRSATR